MRTIDRSVIADEVRPPAACLRDGHAHESRGRLTEALAAYDEGIAAARALDPTPETQRVLGVCWMNRGNALQKLGPPGALHEAVRAYDAAIGVFRELPTAAEPQIRNHLGAAWLNRGHALLAQPDNAAARESFEQAIISLRDLPLGTEPSYRLNLAGAWTNLAHVLLASSASEARVAARSACELLGGHELSHPEFLALSLRARRAWATALGELLVRAEPSAEAAADLADEAAGAIDSGLALVRQLPASSSAAFRPLVHRLFRMGTQLYRVHQSHFLAEFILEIIDHPAFATDAECLAIAAGATAEALADLKRPKLLLANTPATDRVVQTAHALRGLQRRLSGRTNPASSSHDLS